MCDLRYFLIVTSWASMRRVHRQSDPWYISNFAWFGLYILTEYLADNRLKELL